MLSAQLYLAVAIAAVYGSVFARLKRHLGVFAALGAYYGEHLPLGPVAVIPVTACLPCPATRRTALGLIGIAFRSEELLLFSAEGKSSPAISALKWFVLKIHWMTSSLLLLARSFGHPTLGQI